MNYKPTNGFCGASSRLSKSASSPLTAAFTRYSYPTSLLSVCTSLKLFILTGRSSLTLFHLGRLDVQKAIRLRVWLNAHRNHFHQGADYCSTACIQVRCCSVHQIKNSHARTQQQPPHSFAQIYFVYIWTCVLTRLYSCYFAGRRKKKESLTISQLNKWNIKLVRLRASFFVLLHYN